MNAKKAPAKKPLIDTTAITEKLKAARHKAELARRRLLRAKVAHKNAPKVFKLARKAAKEARKKVEKLQKVINKALAAAAKKARAAERALKEKFSTYRDGSESSAAGEG